MKRELKRRRIRNVLMLMDANFKKCLVKINQNSNKEFRKGDLK